MINLLDWLALIAVLASAVTPMILAWVILDPDE